MYINKDEFGRFLDVVIKGVVQRFRWIPPGTFLMGSPHKEPRRNIDEGPQHKVTLTQGFWLADTACTQELWQAVMGHNLSIVDGMAQHPVEQVSWYDCGRFLDVVNESLLVENWRFSLPTEAQWEYACRAGTKGPFWWGKTLTQQDANYNYNKPYAKSKKGEPSDCKTTFVKNFKRNPWGLWQMHGNVWEWCMDYYGLYTGEALTDPCNREGGPEDFHCFRGGSWLSPGAAIRSAMRSRENPWPRYVGVGFRIALKQPISRADSF